MVGLGKVVLALVGTAVASFGVLTAKVRATPRHCTHDRNIIEATLVLISITIVERFAWVSGRIPEADHATKGCYFLAMRTQLSLLVRGPSPLE